MPTLPTVAFFLLAALGLLIIPGPSVLYVVARSVEQGKRAGLASMPGIKLAGLVLTIAPGLTTAIIGSQRK